MIRSHIARGFGKAASRRSLILLLYLVGLGIAALLAVPVVRTIDTLFGSSGFSPEMAERFREEGIYSVQDFAYAETLDLARQLPYNIGKIM